MTESEKNGVSAQSEKTENQKAEIKTLKKRKAFKLSKTGKTLILCFGIIVFSFLIVFAIKVSSDKQHAELIKQNKKYKEEYEQKLNESKKLELVKQHMDTPEYIDYYVRYILDYLRSDEVRVNLND